MGDVRQWMHEKHLAVYLTSAALEASGIDMFKCMCAEGDLVRVSGGESVAYIADTNRNSTSKTYRYKSRYICPNRE